MAVWIHPKLIRNRSARGVDGGHHVLRPAGLEDIDLKGLEHALQRRVRGEVLFDAGHRAVYSHDSSNYRQPPLGVVTPRDAQDVVAAVGACHEHGAPVLMRGCGTSLSGETCNVAVVLDISKYMRTIFEIDRESKTARVEPGVVYTQLNAETVKQGLTFASDTSTKKWATIGGQIGNNSCGIQSVMAGRTSDNVRELEILTYDGLRMRVGQTSEEELEQVLHGGGRRGEIYRRMLDLRDRYASLIRERYPDIPRRVSGYNLDALLPENGFHVARALVGSEGTLVTTLEATLELVDNPQHRTLLVVGYPEVFDAADHVEELMRRGPTGLEAVDDKLLNQMQLQHRQTQNIPLLPEGCGGYLLVEFGGDTREEADQKALEAQRMLGADSPKPQTVIFDDREQEEKLWKIREAGLGATSYPPMQSDHWPGWEDAAVPPGREGDYLREFRQLMDRYGYDAALYGHFGQGCIHCRIDFDLSSAGGVDRWRSFLDEAADLVVSYGGSLSGEHGDGQQRAELLPKMYGEELLEAMREFKAIWDPDNKMNPHKVIDPYPIVSNMKLGADYSPPEVPTFFSYPEDGGSFAHAALRCVGAGACRDPAGGTMCPSYMVTLEEQHTTRGRARILYEMLQGETITDGFRSDEVYEALDLCLSCKGCKGDCPVSVDMATYKAEFLARHFKGRLRPPEAYAMGLIMLHARVAQRLPRLANAVTHAPLIGDLVKRVGGISPKRALPPFAEQTFKAWWRARGANATGDPVVLFPDTFNNFLHPEPMKATAEVLESAGYRVVVPEEALCCGRPLYDYGMLSTAKRFWRRILDVLRPHIQAGTAVVGVEPSCIAAFRDELPNLMPNDEDAKRLALQTLTLAEFLLKAGYDPPQLERKALVHRHCHQEAIIGLSAERELYERMGLDFEVLDSGCCGMAGSFGFEAEHYDVSVKIAEHKLLPKVRGASKETLLIADGFSCKTQVEELSDRRPLHTAQVLKMAIEQGPSGPTGAYPESHFPDLVQDGAGAAHRPAPVLLAGGLLAAGGAAAVRALRARR